VVATTTLVPEQAVGAVDPGHRSRLRQTALQAGTTALRQTLAAAAAGEDGTVPAESALQLLRQSWRTDSSLDTRNAYRRAAQARLLTTLAPSLTPASAATASSELLAALPRTGDHLAREAIARALAALAEKLPDAEREEALATAKIGLAKTGSIEEAAAWARAIAALLPSDPGAATAQIVEALKYPTATEAPTQVLLDALATRWPDEPALKGGTLSDQALLDWFEAHLPPGQRLTEPPARPLDPRSAYAYPTPG
jgi:hypothetical protein